MKKLLTYSFATYSMVVTHSTLSGSLISSTDTTLNSLDFNYVRVE
jgi:hypothetical protein